MSPFLEVNKRTTNPTKFQGTYLEVQNWYPNTVEYPTVKIICSCVVHIIPLKSLLKITFSIFLLTEVDGIFEIFGTTLALKTRLKE
jgi:hypothetical protein